MSTVRPRIRVLSNEQMEQIHHDALKILASVGLRVESARARDVFTAAGARQSLNDTVHIPRELVEQALHSAPSSTEIYDRRGRLVFRAGADRTRFGIGVTNLHYQDPATDAVVPFVRKHMQTAVRLGQLLDGFDLVSTIGVLQDLPVDTADLFATLEMTANTVKPLVILVSEDRCFEPALDLLQYLHGDLTKRPFVIPYFNPISPLVLNASTSDKIMATIARGLPFIYSNYGMSGASTPITPAGTLVLMTAELLAGLVFSQLIKPGTPLILGSLPAVFDMRNMISRYTHQTMLLNLACAEIMARYGLPHAGTSGSGPGWGADLPAAGALWMNHLTSCMGKVGMAPFVGGNFDSLVFSPAMVVYCNEIIRQVLQFSRGFLLTDDLVGLGEIQSVGPGGDFLAADSTLKLCRELYEDSPIWPCRTLDQWQADDNPRAAVILREYTVQSLSELGAPEDHDELIRRGEAFIATVEL